MAARYIVWRRISRYVVIKGYSVQKSQYHLHYISVSRTIQVDCAACTWNQLHLLYRRLALVFAPLYVLGPPPQPVRHYRCKGRQSSQHDPGFHSAKLGIYADGCKPVGSSLANS